MVDAATAGAALASAPVRARARQPRRSRSCAGPIGVALLGLVIVAGYAGEQSGAENLAPTFILITSGSGSCSLSLLFGDVFRAFSPWRAIGRATGALLGRRAPAPHPYPARLGRWPAAVVLLVFAWIELVGRWDSVPRTLASAALGYTVITLAAQAIWGTETWSRRGEGFAVYFNLFSRISVFETRDGVVGVRPPLGGLPHSTPPRALSALVAVMIGTVTFDGFSQGPLWTTCCPTWSTRSRRSASASRRPRSWPARSGCCAGVGLVAGFYWLGIEGAKSVGGG